MTHGTRHTARVPDHRRNRVTGGKHFFTTNPLDRNSRLLVSHVTLPCDTVRNVRTRGGHAFAHGASLLHPRGLLRDAERAGRASCLLQNQDTSWWAVRRV